MNKIKCIQCHKEASIYYIQSNSHIFLVPEKKHIAWELNRTAYKITKNGKDFPKPPAIRVYYCERCKLIWFNIDK